MVTTQNKFQKELQNLFWENKITSDIMRVQQLSFFAELVVEKNKKVNLISRRDIDKIIENHVFISSFISSYVPEKCRNFVDIGTGGGFPGIPLAITRPELNGVLVDSTGKKIDAVREFVDKLKLSNLTVENDRVESNEFIAKYSDQFDLVVSRSSVPLIILF
ncbi:MAG: 16S rRNA (guanine(527)-N(7))-methyltransferase RsmG, partial [Ignavibacteriales bacterium CG12_big_fil_rev_8_21_14_0_65_30_8]